MKTISIRQEAPARPERPAVRALFSVGFRPFFLLAGAWAAIAVPVWLAAYVHGYVLPGPLHPMAWHAHEMVFGFGIAAVAGFLLTAIPNWTGRLPIRGAPLAALAVLWLAGRIALLVSGAIGPAAAAVIDLAFPAVLIAVIARELIAGRNYRNLPMLAALALLFAGNALAHLQVALGQRLGIATLLALIALVGGRIVPSFTRNWLVKAKPAVREPAPMGKLDLACLLVIVIGLAAWVAVPDLASIPLAAAGAAAAARLSRWRGLATLREPLLFVLHVGYAWLAFGLAYMGLNGLFGWTPPGAPLHALTVGAIGTMTLAVMTRATRGHTGRALTADAATIWIYLLVTLAAVLRVAAPWSSEYVIATTAAGIAWCAAFTLFVLRYGPMLLRRS
jgi:uncharacterized protein involved in response to NO